MYSILLKSSQRPKTKRKMVTQRVKTQIVPYQFKKNLKSLAMANFLSLVLHQCKSIVSLIIFNRKAPKLTKKSSAGVVRVNHENLIDPQVLAKILEIQRRNEFQSTLQMSQVGTCGIPSLWCST